MTMNKIIELFRKELVELNNLKDTTVRIYIDRIYDYTDYTKNLLKIDILTSKTWHINKWIFDLKTTGKGYNFLKDTKAALKRFFDFLVKTGYVKKNPAEILLRIKIPKSDMNKPIDTKIIFRLLKSFKKSKWIQMRNFTIVSILWALGLRVNELLKIKRCDLNMEYDAEHRIGTLLVHGKGDKERTLFIVDTLYNTISHYLNLKKTPKRKGSLIFTGSKGKCISGSRVRQLIKEACRRTGVTTRIVPLSFRHTFATNMYNHKVPVEAIRRMMGHETLRETTVYIHISDKLKEEALKKISIKEEVS